MNFGLNERAMGIVEDLTEEVDELRIAAQEGPNGALLLDFGVETEGGIEAGILLASLTLSGLADVQINSGQLGGTTWPEVAVWTDYPVPACLFSQYAGWKVSAGKYFGMGSGPMRAAAAKEPLFDQLWYKETDVDGVVGVIESGTIPGEDIFEMIADACHVQSGDTVLAVAPTSSFSGNLQVVARSCETALHKLHELGFDVHRVRSAYGVAPLPPIANNDLQGIGRTNDAIIYGGRVSLWVVGDDDSLSSIIQKVPSCSSAMHGELFLDAFEKAGRDFYAIDPLLFSPAEIVIQNVETGRVHVAGTTSPDILRRSFGFA